jgi:hypothetical protein
MKHQDYINDFFIFLLKTEPKTVNRILKDLQIEGKCGKAPELAQKVVKELRKKDIIKKLAKIDKKNIFSTLLIAGNDNVLNLITDLVKELSATKINGCRIPQNGGAKKRSIATKLSNKKQSVSKKRSIKKRSIKKRSIKKRSIKKQSAKQSTKKQSITKKRNTSASKGKVKIQKTPCFKDKVATVMGEFKRGKLKTSAGMKVTNRSQAIAIALSTADKYC